ncbi:hypothetical protein B0H10DRAFT_2211585 [Mycena sp. CBHHK59/15]|nr:hypothetical protein B0H10DRAFT_2211585 [Mycena sp. CBHHK59/15]
MACRVLLPLRLGAALAAQRRGGGRGAGGTSAILGGTLAGCVGVQVDSLNALHPQPQVQSPSPRPPARPDLTFLSPLAPFPPLPLPCVFRSREKGNKSFVAFSNLNDSESLTKTWKVCTKVASYLEQGQRLENLSWRLWHLQNLMVDTDNAKSKREFKKLSKCMGDKLDKEKGRSIEELPAPAFTRNPSTDLIRQRAVEKERTREAGAHAPEHTLQRMQFTFAVEPSAPASAPNSASAPAATKRKRADGADADAGDAAAALRFPTLFSTSFGPAALLYPAPSLAPRMNYGEAPYSHSRDNSNSTGSAFASPNKDGDTSMSIARPTIELPLDELLNADADADDTAPDAHSVASSDTHASSASADSGGGSGQDSGWAGWDAVMAHVGAGGFDFAGHRARQQQQHAQTQQHLVEGQQGGGTLNPNALNLNLNLRANAHANHPSPSPKSPRLSPNVYFVSELEEEEGAGAHDASQAHDYAHQYDTATSNNNANNPYAFVPADAAAAYPAPTANGHYDADPLDDPSSSSDDSDDSDFFEAAQPRRRRTRPVLSVKTGVRAHHGSQSSSSGGGGARRSGGGGGKRAGPGGGAGGGAGGRGAGAGAMPPPARQAAAPQAQVLNANSAPGGVKAECSNCGATHTPLWRRGLNDELNCNACGLYCKLHKRPRPKTMRSTAGNGEGRGQSVRAEAVDVMAQCYNCHTTATPLWRKDDEGKTVCNACGLYYKLHGSARPISMKSDVIRKRSRHDARRGGASVSETPTASPGVSRRASPAPASVRGASPTLAPDSTTAQITYEPSELASALGRHPTPPGAYAGGAYAYHAEYTDALPFASVDVGAELRGHKRRRMSVDSASEPPSSAVSYASYADGYSGRVAVRARVPVQPLPGGRVRRGGRRRWAWRWGNGNGNGNGGGVLRGGAGGNAFWHPPMMLQGESGGSPSTGVNHLHSSPGSFLHPPMLPTPEDAPMDFLHPPMMMHQGYQQQQQQQHEEEERMNSFFGGYMQHSPNLHPPMMLPGDEHQMMGMMGGGLHPPMMYDDVYDANGNMRY